MLPTILGIPKNKIIVPYCPLLSPTPKIFGTTRYIANATKEIFSRVAKAILLHFYEQFFDNSPKNACLL